MNYIKQINAFWNFRLLNKTSHSETALYFAILHCANNSGWKSDVAIPNSTLINLAAFSDASQLSKVRNRLVQLNLIEYKKGSAKTAGTYKITKLYKDDESLVSLFDSNMYNNTYNYSDNNMYNNTAVKDTIYININKTKENKTKDTPCNPPRGMDDDDISLVVNLFNSICVSYKPVVIMTQTRKRNILSRLQYYSFKEIEQLFRKAEASSFLKGEVTDWSADFDWIIADKNIGKILDGCYDDKFNKNTDIEKAFMQSYCFDE